MQNDGPLISNPSLKNAVMCSFLRKRMCPVFNYTNAISLCLNQNILEQNFSLSVYLELYRIALLTRTVIWFISLSLQS